MAVIGTQMSEEDVCKTVLSKCLTKLRDDMNPTLILDELEGKHLFLYSTLRDIREKPNTSDKNREIVMKIGTKGVKGYRVFKDCLNKTLQQHLADHLTKAEDKLKHGKRRHQLTQQQTFEPTQQPLQQLRPQLGQQHTLQPLQQELQEPLQFSGNFSRLGKEIPLPTETSNSSVSKTGENKADTSLSDTRGSKNVSFVKGNGDGSHDNTSLTYQAEYRSINTEPEGKDATDGGIQEQSNENKESPFEERISKDMDSLELTDKGEGSPFEENTGGITQARIVDKCIHDGRLKTLKKTWVHSNTKKEPMDKGGFGMVYDCGRNDSLEMNLALKKIDYTTDGKDIEKSAHNEKLAARVMHWAITPLLGIFEEKNTTYFMLPLLENRDLHSAIKSGTPTLSGNEIMTILYQIASAIVFLHTKVKGFRSYIIHGDVTSRNIVLDVNKNGRLIDFGRSIALNDGETGRTITAKTGVEKSRVTRNNDWEAFGIVSLEMLTNKVRFYEDRKDLRNLTDLQVKRMAEKEEQVVWDNSVKKELAKMASRCFESRSSKEIEKFEDEIMEELQNILRSKGDNKKWRLSQQPLPRKKRCVICMVNPANSSITDHDSKCNMYICVACLRNSYLNPIQCHSCFEHIASPIGTKWGAILIAGNDLIIKSAGKLFTKEIDELRKIIVSKHPMVVGISELNLHFIHPLEPGVKKDKLKETVIEAFDDLKKKIDDKTVDTVIIYYSGHYDKDKHGNDMGFRFGSKEEYFTKEDLESEIKDLSKVEKIYVFLDCCSAPNAIPMLSSKTMIQINACKPSEKVFMNALGSPFTQTFMTTLVGKAHKRACGRASETGTECVECKSFYCEDDFITMEKMLTSIDDHVKHPEPIINCSVVNSKAIRIGYFIEKHTPLEFLTHQEDDSLKPVLWSGMVDKEDKVEHFKTVLLRKMLTDVDETLGKYFHIVAVSVRTGPKKTDIEELQTTEQIISAWNGKRQLYARIRDVDNIRHGRVARFLKSNEDANTKSGVEANNIISILKQLLGDEMYVVKEEVHMIKIDATPDKMLDFEKRLKDLQKTTTQSIGPELKYLLQLVDEFLDLPKLDTDFPYLSREDKTVHPQFFVVSLEKKHTTPETEQ